MAGAFLDWVSGPAWPQGTQRPYEILRGRARRDLPDIGINPRKRELLRGYAVYDTPRHPSQKDVEEAEEANETKTSNHLYCFSSFRSLSDAPSPLSDMDFFTRRERY